jgi:hypothetical protein
MLSMHSSKNTITNEMKENNGLCRSLIDYLIDESSLVSLINEFV